VTHSARATEYIGSSLPTSSCATTGRRQLTPRTTAQVRIFEQLLDKQTGALLALPQLTPHGFVPEMTSHPVSPCAHRCSVCALRVFRLS